MLVIDPDERPIIKAGDRTLLKELLHPAKHPVDLRYSLAHAALPPDEHSSPHKLRSSEVYYILAGSGIMHIDGEARPVVAGQTIYIPPGAAQHIENAGDVPLAFLCIVDPAWRAEDEEVDMLPVVPGD